jgi:hypothetical protein
MNGAGVETVKEAGKISRLEAMLASNPVQGTTGIRAPGRPQSRIAS